MRRACSAGAFSGAGASRSQADVVIGAPDSGLDAALGYAQAERHSLRHRLYQEQIRRPHLHSAGSQAQRENSVRIKLNAISATVQGQARRAGG